MAVVTHAHLLQNFYTTWVLACQKRRLGPKLEGAGLGENQKIWDHLCISATVEADNFKFVHKLGLGLAYQKRRLAQKISGGLARGAHTKIWDPLCISATVEASNFKFGTQIWFETSLPKRCLGPKLAGVLARGASKKVGTHTYSCNR